MHEQTHSDIFDCENDERWAGFTQSAPIVLQASAFRLASTGSGRTAVVPRSALCLIITTQLLNLVINVNGESSRQDTVPFFSSSLEHDAGDEDSGFSDRIPL